MPSLARITGAHPKKGHWVYVIRKSPSAVFGVILDGKGVADTEGRQIPLDILDLSRYSCVAGVLDLNKSSFRHFPVRIYGQVTPGNPSGEYELFSATGDPCPVGKGILPSNTIPVSATPGPQSVQPTTVSPSPKIAPPAQPASAPIPMPPPVAPPIASSDPVIAAAVASPAPIVIVKPAPPKPVVHKPRPMVMPTTSGILGAEPDGTPIVSIDRIAEFLDGLPTRVSMMLWGPAGVGKSAVVHDWANERNKRVYEIRLGAIDPTALQGIGVPDMVARKCVWLPNELIPDEPNSVLFLDELTQAPQTIQALAYQITLDRAIGNRRLPDDCRVICAGNRVTDRGVAFAMPSPLANRLFHLTIKPDIATWRKWALASSIDTRVISFLSVKPDMLHAMPTTNSSGSWPSPRSWANVNAVLNGHFTPAGMGVGIAAEVGVPAAKEFIRHCVDFERYTKKVLGILDGVEKGYVENDPSRAFTVAVAVVANATDDTGTLVNILEWANNQNEEFASVVVRGLEERFGEDVLADLANVNASVGATIKKAATASESLTF